MACKNDLGLARSTVILVDHNPRWSEYFVQEKEILFQIMGSTLVDVRHIGSTSIPGIPAKPILDIVAAIRTLSDVERFREDVIRIGYQDKQNGGVSGRRYFVKGQENNRTHHLNFCEVNSVFWTTHLAFRNYLEHNTEAAQQYAALKRTLAEKFPNDRLSYTTGKEEFVHSILKLAGAGSG